MTPGCLESAKAAGIVYEVAMDEAKFLAFGQDGLTAIGTANLNGCSAVMIVSVYGTILAHIPPRPNGHSRDVHAGDNHARTKMREVAALYNAHSEYFPTGGNSWVVCAVFQGEVALPDQQRIFQDGLTSLGLSHSPITYVAGRRDRNNLNPGQGTVFIDGGGPVPVIYVEDTVVSERSNWSTPTYPSQTSTSYPTRSSAYPSSSYPAGSSAYPGESSTQAGPSQVSESSQAGNEEYYYVHDKQYFLYDHGQHILQPGCPKNVWVFNKNGWSDSNGKKWRYWDGKKVTYS